MNTLSKALIITIILSSAFIAVSAQDAILVPRLAEFPYAAKQKRDVMMPEGAVNAGEPANLINPASYQFSALSGVAFEDMSTGTTLLMPDNTGGDFNSLLAQIGFLYRFDNVFYTSFGASGRGFVRLGSRAESPNGTNVLDSAANSPKIAPYWDGLCTAIGGKVHYKLVDGPIGVRKLVIEWRAMGPQCGFLPEGNRNFQLWLYDRTGVIQFVYGNGMVPVTFLQGYSVGIQSGAATNFASVDAATNSVNYATANNNQMATIAAGTSYVFTPNMPAAVSGLTATPGQTSVTVNWTDNASNETTYLVRRTTDHTTFYFVADTLPPNSNTFTDTGLQPDTQYFYYVNALTEGAFGPDVFVGATTLPAGTKVSTASGGPWNSPSTWVGNVVPGATDDVTIADGAIVTIDTQATVHNVTVGSTGSRTNEGAKDLQPEGGAPAALKFGETGAFSLTTGADVTINSNGTLSTGGGNANQHVLRVRGNLKNDGVLDLSTNNNQAGAGLVFESISNNTFSGTGPVTDVRTITVDKGSRDYVLEASVANFTVQGSASDGPSAGYLYLLGGTYKISGNFTGNFRTFPSANYQISAATGFILNNPNYTVTAQQNSNTYVFGRLGISAGTFNVGTQVNDSLVFIHGSSFSMSGGRINTAGAFKTQSDGILPLTYAQTGGLITTCTVSGSNACFYVKPTNGGDTFAFTGGEIALQNSGYSYIDNALSMAGSNTAIRYGNEFTTQISNFTVYGNEQANIVIDTRGGGHTVVLPSGEVSARNIDIGAGATLNANQTRLTITGESFINNGSIRSGGSAHTTSITFAGENPVYSGSGTTIGPLSNLGMRCGSLTLDSTNNLRVRIFSGYKGNLIHSNKLTLGNNDATRNFMFLGEGEVEGLGTVFDVAPTFELGTGGQSLIYEGDGPDRTTGVEVNPTRILAEFSYNSRLSGSRLYIEGGDLTVGDLVIGGVGTGIFTGQNKIVHLGILSSGGGYVNGEIEKRFVGPEDYYFPFGGAAVEVDVTSVGVDPSYLSIRSFDGPLPGLLPATSSLRHVRIRETGDLTVKLMFQYRDTERRGNEANYQIWRSTGGAPALVPFSTRNVDFNYLATNPGLTDFDGLWGIGEMADPGPVSISGSIFTAEGAGIRNALVQISGGNLPAPVNVYTGQFGTYSFDGLQAGEVYTVKVGAKRYRFGTFSRDVTPFNNLTGIDFTANPRE